MNEITVKYGGFGIRSAVWAPSAFLASTSSSAVLVEEILPPPLKPHPLPSWMKQRCTGQLDSLLTPRSDCRLFRQKSWDTPRMTSIAQCLLDNAESDEEHARLLVLSNSESGAWLRVFPVSALGFHMDDNTVRTTVVGVRLGGPVCGAHQCRHCSALINNLGRHTLSCRRSEGRHNNLQPLMT